MGTGPVEISRLWEPVSGARWLCQACPVELSWFPMWLPWPDAEPCSRLLVPRVCCAHPDARPSLIFQTSEQEGGCTGTRGLSSLFIAPRG